MMSLISTWELLLLKTLPAAILCTEVPPLPLLIMEQTLLTMWALCLQVVSMDSLLLICRLLILEPWDQACRQPIDQASHLYMVDSLLSTKQLVEVLA